MYNIKPTSRFKKDLKLLAKRGYNIDLLSNVIKLIATGNPLPARYRDHELKGNWIGHRECHVTPDWLLIYKLDNDIIVLTLTRSGTHSDLF